MKHFPGTHKLKEVYTDILKKNNVVGNVLEIGCGPSKETLLNLETLKNCTRRIGINLREIKGFDFDIIECPSWKMSEKFKPEIFDAVLCNMVLEHDKFFWVTLSQVYYVLKPGGVFILGVPGLVSKPERCKYVLKNIKNTKIPLNSTYTHRVHNAPGDYWRFTEQAYKEILMDGYTSVEFDLYLIPPLLIGYGIKNA